MQDVRSTEHTFYLPKLHTLIYQLLRYDTTLSIDPEIGRHEKVNLQLLRAIHESVTFSSAISKSQLMPRPIHKVFSEKSVGKFYSALVLCLIFAIPLAHLAGGKRGLIAMFRLKNQINQATVRLDVVRAERIALENQVTLLSASSVDLDMLDEKARQILDFASPKEIIVLPRNLE